MNQSLFYFLQRKKTKNKKHLFKPVFLDFFSKYAPMASRSEKCSQYINFWSKSNKESLIGQILIHKKKYGGERRQILQMNQRTKRMNFELQLNQFVQLLLINKKQQFNYLYLIQLHLSIYEISRIFCSNCRTIFSLFLNAFARFC